MIPVTEPTYWTVLDVGTNTVLALTAADDGTGLHILHEFCTTTRLGEGVDQTGLLGEIPMQRTVEALADLTAKVQMACPEGHGVAVATSAVREAANAQVFLEQCSSQVGFSPRVLSGQEEARLTFLGASNDLPDGETVVALDIGGGSSELTAGIPGECEFAESIPIGCVRFAERYELSDASSVSESDAAVQDARRQLLPYWERICRMLGNRQPKFVVSGGTATSLAAVLQAREEYDRQAVHGHLLDRASVADVLNRTVSMTVQDRAGLPGLHPGRAPVFPAGLAILRAAMDLFGCESATVSTRGLRYGAVLAMRMGRMDVQWTW